MKGTYLLIAKIKLIKKLSAGSAMSNVNFSSLIFNKLNWKKFLMSSSDPPLYIKQPPPSLKKSASYLSMITAGNNHTSTLSNISDSEDPIHPLEQPLSTRNNVARSMSRPKSSSMGSNKSSRTRKTRFSIFGGLPKGGKRKKQPRRTKYGRTSTTRRKSAVGGRDSFNLGKLTDDGRADILQRTLANDYNFDMNDEEEQDDCNACYEEL